jgi:hypothetical protein
MMTTPQKLKEMKRPRSNVKNYLQKKTLINEEEDSSQDCGQESDIINLDSRCTEFLNV